LSFTNPAFLDVLVGYSSLSPPVMYLAIQRFRLRIVDTLLIVKEEGLLLNDRFGLAIRNSSRNQTLSQLLFILLQIQEGVNTSALLRVRWDCSSRLFNTRGWRARESIPKSNSTVIGVRAVMPLSE